MERRWTFCLAGAVLLIAGAARADVCAMKGKTCHVRVGGLVQELGFGQELNDPVRNHARVYLFVPEARLRVRAHFDRFSFVLEEGLGPEQPVLAPTPGVSIGLLDMAVNVWLGTGHRTYLKFGQFKVPYGREELTYSGNLLFADRSIDFLGFKIGRDVGAAFVTQPGLFTLVAGIFTGGGRDVPPAHYLPEALGVPMLVARIGIGNAQEDPFYLSETVRDLKAPQWSLDANALFMRDSLIGHSSVLNVKASDKSLLLDSDWNPYIAVHPLNQGDWVQAGADGLVRLPVGLATVSGEAQFDYAKFSNIFGAVALAGLRLQASVARGPLQAGLRYAVLFPDPSFAVGKTPVSGGQPIHEITPAVSYYIVGNYLKVTADLPILLHVPVFTEPKVGSYVGTEFPDEAALLSKGGSVGRQNVVEGRLQLQAQF